ncbi:MFS transporter, partial [Acinetobacter baumannii]
MRTLSVTVLIYSVFTGLTALSKSVEHITVLRFFTGLGIGGEWAAGTALVAESLPDHWRPRSATFLQSAAAFGPILAAIANF